MVALEWNDIDFHSKRHGQIVVQRSAWKGQIDTLKGGRIRFVPENRSAERAAMRPPSPARCTSHKRNPIGEPAGASETFPMRNVW